MKKFYTYIVLLSQTFATSVLAQESLEDKLQQVAEGGSSDTQDVQGFFETVGEGTGLETIARFIGTLINFLLSFLGVIFLLLIIYAGFRWMFSRGNEEEVSKAQKIMISSFQGLVIVAVAYAVVQFVGVIFANFIQ